MHNRDNTMNLSTHYVMRAQNNKVKLQYIEHKTFLLYFPRNNLRIKNNISKLYVSNGESGTYL